MDANTNTGNPPASNGMSIEEAALKIAELERERRGILEDTKAERRKRQELEDRLSRMEATVNSAPRQPEVMLPQDSLRDVEKFAANPRGWAAEVLKPLVAPLLQQNEVLSRQAAYRDAIDWLAEQEDSKPSKIKGSKLEDELQRIAKDHNLGAMDIYNGTQAAYRIYQAEKMTAEKAAAKAEAERTASINQNSTQAPVVSSQTSSNKRVWKESEIPTGADWDKYRSEILTAYAEGRVIAGQ